VKASKPVIPAAGAKKALRLLAIDIAKNGAAAASVFPQFDSEQNAYWPRSGNWRDASIEPPAQPVNRPSIATPTPNMATAPGSGVPASKARMMLPEKPTIDTAGPAMIPS